MKFEIPANRLKFIGDVINISTSAIGGKEVDLVEDVVIDVRSNMISSSFSDKSNPPYFIGRVEVSKGFKVIEEGKLNISNLSDFIEYIKLFRPTDNLIVEEKDGKIYLKREVPAKVISFPALSKEEGEKRESVVNEGLSLLKFNEQEKVWEGRKFKWKSYFEILASKFIDILDDVKKVGGKEIKFPLTISPEKVVLSLESVDKMVSIERVLEVSKLVAEETISNTYSFGLDGVLKVLDEKVRVWMAKDAPLIIERLDVGDGIRYYYILPPYLG